RPVRRAVLLRDPRRQDHRHAQGRRVPDAHARLLELHGYDRRAEQLRDLGLVLRRQGTATANQCREPRCGPGAVPQRQRHQHREEGMSWSSLGAATGAPRRLLARDAAIPEGAILSREEAQALIDRIKAMSKADEIQVTIFGGYQTNVRFANNQMSTA